MSDFERRVRPDELADASDALAVMNAPLHGEGSPLGPIVPDAPHEAPPSSSSSSSSPGPDGARAQQQFQYLIDHTPHPASDNPPHAASSSSSFDPVPHLGGVPTVPQAEHDPTARDHARQSLDDDEEARRQHAAGTDQNPVGTAVAGAVPERTGHSVGDRAINAVRGVVTGGAAAPARDPDLDRANRSVEDAIHRALPRDRP
jgi:hypothetical protein